MRFHSNFRMALCFALAASVQLATAAERMLDRATRNQLSALHPGQTLAIDAFPVGPTQIASIRFERVKIYSDDAHLYLITAAGKKVVPRSDHIFLRGYSTDGGARVAMSLNPDGSFAEGSGDGPEGSFALYTKTANGAVTWLIAQKFESTLPSGFQFDFRCGNENANLAARSGGDLAAQLHAAIAVRTAAPQPASASTLRLAIVAVDTDSLFMSRLFANNTTTATNWIAGMFNTMNTMYENDLQVRLLIGTTILRTSSGSDPYTGFSPGATTSELDFFANYWRLNEVPVNRAFAILLSGQEPSTASSCSASGIAWIDAYCDKGQTFGSDTFGSYSVNQVCTSINIDPNGSFNARIVGHEIGHNFGAFHTHCTNTSTGAAPTGTNTIDQCHSGEVDNGTPCYSGATSCPVASAGTIMSYCNFSTSGCASGTQNLLQFHATQINQVLLPTIGSHTPACLLTDEIFRNGFE